MEYFVIQVRTGQEKTYKKFVSRSNPELKYNLLWLRRKLRIKKAGTWKLNQYSLFPGYLILAAEEYDYSYFNKLKQVKGFIRYLPDNKNIKPVSRNDKKILLHFLSYGEVTGISKVVLDTNKRIVVKRGPLKGLEGRIIKVNKRKKRAKVKLNMQNSHFFIDFGFDYITAHDKKNNNKN